MMFRDAIGEFSVDMTVVRIRHMDMTTFPSRFSAMPGSRRDV
jgi:hypothetical protein